MITLHVHFADFTTVSIFSPPDFVLSYLLLLPIPQTPQDTVTSFTLKNKLSFKELLKMRRQKSFTLPCISAALFPPDPHFCLVSFPLKYLPVFPGVQSARIKSFSFRMSEKSLSCLCLGNTLCCLWDYRLKSSPSGALMVFLPRWSHSFWWELRCNSVCVALRVVGFCFWLFVRFPATWLQCTFL